MMNSRVTFAFSMLIASAMATCIPSETNICMTLDVHASETGYYNLDRGSFENTNGSSPDITVTIGQTITFDQSDKSNWYHPVGFAYAPDGAHGDDWGADENPEIEGADQLKYTIDGLATTCPDAGDTGLDCYEPEFFYPLGEWTAKTYAAELTITDDVAATSKGGVIYYFCHIHSKMSGKIILKNPDGSFYMNNSQELELYSPIENDTFDTGCGTTGTSMHADGGDKECNMKFLPGSHSTDFEQCLQAVDCQMHWDMFSETSDHGNKNDKIVTFMQQMIPHHQNAVNMAKLLLKHSTQSELDAVEDLEDMLLSIVHVQNYQIHQFRNYLNPNSNYLDGSNVVPPSTTTTSSAGLRKFMHVIAFFSFAAAYMVI